MTWITVTATDDAGRLAALSVQVEADWVALEMQHRPDMAGFKPSDILSFRVDQDDRILAWDKYVLVTT